MVNISKVKARMVEKNLTQEQIAEKLGVDRSTFNRKINNADGQYLTVKEAYQLMGILEIVEPKEYFFCE